MSNSPGKIFVVSTPIGNLEDITFRAVRVLKEVDFILCEDTRITQKLLNHYEIKTKLIPYHKFNESQIVDSCLSLLKDKKNIALVSDAGTPLISDPGMKLIAKSREKGVNVFSIPGPSSLTAALSVFGEDFKDFLFVGFLPEKKSEREKLIKSFSSKSDFILLFVAPHDFKKYAEEVFNFYPESYIYYSRELTKLYEDFWCGNIADLINKLNKDEIVLKGEIVVGLKINLPEIKPDSEKLLKKIDQLVSSGISLKEASKLVSKEYSMSSKGLYDSYLKKYK